MEQVWENAKKQLETIYPEKTFSMWIRSLLFCGFDDNVIVIGCPNKFSRNWIKENYQEDITAAIKSATGQDFSIKLQVNSGNNHTKIGTSEDDFSSLGLGGQLPIPSFPQPVMPGLKAFKPLFTFDRFIVGPSNEFAYSLSNAMAEGVIDYQFLFVAAQTGLGKTHLSHAIGHKIIQKNPNTKVMYITAEDFTNEMVASINAKKTESFKKRYRESCDVLLLDEIHFLSGKEGTQRELGYTLDALANSNKKVIFTSSLAPKDIPRMSTELCSRLTSGLISTINRPDFETKVKILQTKSKEKKLSIKNEIIHFLAKKSDGDIRKLESTLNYLEANSKYNKSKIDLSLAENALSFLGSEEKTMSSGHIVQMVSKYYKISPEAITSKSRKKVYAIPRNICAYLSKKYTNETLESIAKTINRTYSSVLYAYELVERDINKDHSLKKQIDFLGNKIQEIIKKI